MDEGEAAGSPFCWGLQGLRIKGLIPQPEEGFEAEVAGATRGWVRG